MHARGSGLDREALDSKPTMERRLLPRPLAIPPAAEPLAVKTAPTHQCAPRGSGLDREAFDPHARRGAGYYRDGLRYLQTPKDSRSRPLPHVKCTRRGSGLDREAFDPKPTMEHRAITETACDTYSRRTTRGQDRSHTSNALPHINAHPVGAVSTAKLLIHTHDGAPAITETACDTSKRRTTRGQDRSHSSMVAGKGASC